MFLGIHLLPFQDCGEVVQEEHDVVSPMIHQVLLVLWPAIVVKNVERLNCFGCVRLRGTPPL